MLSLPVSRGGLEGSVYGLAVAAKGKAREVPVSFPLDMVLILESLRLSKLDTIHGFDERAGRLVLIHMGQF